MEEIIRGVRGYKVFNPDWTCNDYQYSCPGVFEENVDPELCMKGFHFCRKISDCFTYYDFNPDNKVAEVEALGQTVFSNGDSKCCTNKISIVRELSWGEILYLANIGVKCYGYGNSGRCNDGYFNSGACNVGNYNAGMFNNGIKNTGNCNMGTKNSGDFNIGNSNTGDYNCGDLNTGKHNTGNFNTGDWNTASRCCGCFMTEDQPFFMFNRPTDITYSQWIHSSAHQILNQIFDPPIISAGSDNSINDEVKAMDISPHSEITGVSLAKTDPKNSAQRKWDELCNEDKQCVMDLPNFDKYIFYECTGIKID